MSQHGDDKESRGAEWLGIGMALGAGIMSARQGEDGGGRKE